MLGKLNMLSLGMSTNIQTCLEIIVNIWSKPGPGAFMAPVDPYLLESKNREKNWGKKMRKQQNPL